MAVRISYTGELGWELYMHKPGMRTVYKKLMESGKFKTVIDRCYPLEQIRDAYRYVEKGQKTGNVVITIKDQNK